MDKVEVGYLKCGHCMFSKICVVCHNSVTTVSQQCVINLLMTIQL